MLNLNSSHPNISATFLMCVNSVWQYKSFFAIQSGVILTMGTMGTHWPTAVVQFSNNSNYFKLLKGSNCLDNIIKVAANVLVLLFSMA